VKALAEATYGGDSLGAFKFAYEMGKETVVHVGESGVVAVATDCQIVRPGL
jgi:hypothetical protein